MNFTDTYASRMKNNVTKISIIIHLFSKKFKILNAPCNSMEGGRRHLFPLTSIEKSHCTVGVQLAVWEWCQSNTD